MSRSPTTPADSAGEMLAASIGPSMTWAALSRGSKHERYGVTASSIMSGAKCEANANGRPSAPMQGGQGIERLGDGERCVVGQHDAARSDADMQGAGRDVGDPR